MSLFGEKRTKVEERKKDNRRKAQKMASEIDEKSYNGKKIFLKTLGLVLCTGLAGVALTGCTTAKTKDDKQKDISISSTETDSAFVGPIDENEVADSTFVDSTEETIESTTEPTTELEKKYINAYADPSSDSKIVQKIEDWTEIEILDSKYEEDGTLWTKIKNNDSIAWVSSDECSFSKNSNFYYVNSITVGGKLQEGQSIEVKTVTTDGEQIETLPYGYSFDPIMHPNGEGASLNDLPNSSPFFADYDAINNQIILLGKRKAGYIEKDPSVAKLYYIDADYIDVDYFIDEIYTKEDYKKCRIRCNPSEKEISEEAIGYVNVRSEPSSSSSLVRKINDGEPIILNNEDDDASYAKDELGYLWRKIGENEWVRSDLLKRCGFSYDGHIARTEFCSCTPQSASYLLVYQDSNGKEKIADNIIYTSSSGYYYHDASIVAIADSKGKNLYNTWSNSYYYAHKDDNSKAVDNENQDISDQNETDPEYGTFKVTIEGGRNIRTSPDINDDNLEFSVTDSNGNKLSTRIMVDQGGIIEIDKSSESITEDGFIWKKCKVTSNGNVFEGYIAVANTDGNTYVEEEIKTQNIDEELDR